MATMSDTNWDNFPTAISCLMDEENDNSADYIINSRLQAFRDKYFVWLNEIPDEIERILSGNVSNQLTILPKTPSVKNRARIFAKVIEESEDVSNDSPAEIIPGKIAPLESQVADVPKCSKGRPRRSRQIATASKTASIRQVAIVVDSPKGRPKRSCRNRTTTSHTASTRKASRQTTKAQAPAPQPEIVTPIKRNEVLEAAPAPQPEIVTPIKRDEVMEADSDFISADSTRNVAGDTVKSKAVSHHVGFEDKTDNQSPSVRDRARAYETMLNHKTKSPVKVSTPNSASRNFTSATISSLAKSSPRLCIKRLSSPYVSKMTSKVTPKRGSSRRSSKATAKRSSRSSRLFKSQSEHSTLTPNPTKSKLRLVKKSASVVDQSSEVNCEDLRSPTKVLKKGKNRSSLDSALSSATSTMSPKSSSCDEEQQTADENFEPEKNLAGSGVREQEEDMDEGLDMTHTVITEVYDLSADGKESLVDYEKIQTKTVPASVQDCVSDTQVSEEEDESAEDNSTGTVEDDGHQTFTKESPVESSPVARTTRTRARNLQARTSMESCAKNSPSPTSAPASYTGLKDSPSKDDDSTDKTPDEEEPPRMTRTRTRARTQQETEKPEETGGTRTRKRQLAESSIRDVSVVLKAPEPALSPAMGDGMRSTRSRMRQQTATNAIPCGAYDQVVAGSPAMKTANGIRCSQKRPVEEYGNSPRSKRSRSCAGTAGSDSTFNAQSILLTSSPRREQDEDEDTVDCSLMSSVRRPPNSFNFTSAQKSSFMKRTPAFARTNSKVYSFLGNTTPTQNNSTALSSFLKRNTPKSKTTPLQALQEQKKQKLQEKENKERERLRRAGEAKKQKLEEQKRMRDDRLRKVAEARGKKLREELEHKERFNRKLEDQATLKDKVFEEKLRAETEKKELREKKMMEANSRRRQEEEERSRKRAELEDETRRQKEWLQRKKECEEEERKKHLEEEKRKQEERMLKVQEEKAKQKRLEEEKKERVRKERERQQAIERAEKERERERIEKERREEKERRQEEQRRQEDQKRAEEQRRLQEIKRAQEQEKIRIMEAAHKRAQEEVMRIEREREAKKIELQKLIANSKNTAALNTSASSKGATSSYMITPVKANVYKPSTDPNNYDIGDKVSDDSTDDDEAPKKKIPEWACGVFLNTALIKQYKYPPDVNDIFRPHLVEAPDLVQLFPTSRQRHRFRYRTSSAIWTSPAMKK